MITSQYKINTEDDTVKSYKIAQKRFLECYAITKVNFSEFKKNSYI